MANGFLSGRRAGQVIERTYPKRELQFIRTQLSVAAHGRREVILRELERVDVEFRRACFGLPISEDPIYPVMRALFPEGAEWREIGRAYGVSHQRAQQLLMRARGKLRNAFPDGELTPRAATAWEEIELHGDPS